MKLPKAVCILLAIVGFVFGGLVLGGMIRGALMARAQIRDETTTNRWVAFTAKDQGFSALFPTVPVRSHQHVTNQTTVIEMRQFVAETSPTTAFAVSVATIPLALASNRVERVLSTVRGGFEKLGARVGSQKTISWSNHPGAEWEMEAFQGARITVRVVMAEEKYYVVSGVRHTRATNRIAQVRQFIDSFQLLESPQ